MRQRSRGRRARLTAALVIALASCAARGGEETIPAVATRTAAAPVIDGDLSDPPWSLATPLASFTQQTPDEGARPSQATEVRILYDDARLYFGIRCWDQEPQAIVARLSRRDRDSASDALTIDLDTRGDHLGAFHFEVNAAGVQRDALRTGDQSLNFDWDAVWSSATRVDATGWSAEIAIPFAALRYSLEDLSRWRLQVRRYLARRNEIDAWVPIPRDAQGELQRYGRLDGLAGLPASIGVELLPFGLVRGRDRRAPASLGLPAGRDLSADIGLDAQVRLTPGLTLNATVLPDFGQVEADRVILNLSTFELFYPEKRPFFLESADLFTLPDVFGEPQAAQLFYSRRIGAGIASPLVPAGASQLETPERARLLGAVKLSGKLGDRVSLALLDGLSASEQATLSLGPGSQFAEGLVPLTNTVAGRVLFSAGAGLTAGATVTGVWRAEERGQLGFSGTCPAGTPAGADGRCLHDAVAASVDLRWQDDEGGFLAGVTAMASRLLRGPADALPDGTLLGPGSTGAGLRVELAKASGHLLADWVYEAYSPQIDLNDAGFLLQQSLHRVFTRTAWRALDWGPTRATEFGVELFGRNSWDGVKLARGLQVNHKATWSNAWTSWIELQRYPSADDNRETRDGSITERADQYGIEFIAGTNPSAPLVFNLESLARSTWRGFSLGASLTVAARPLDRLELSLGGSLIRVTGDPRWVDTIAGAGGQRSYRFGLQDALAPSGILRATYTLTTHLTLQAYAQLFFASVRYGQLYEVPKGPGRARVSLGDLAPSGADASPYEERDAVLNLNLVLRWEFLPGSVAYLVYSRGHQGGLAPATDDAGRPYPRPRLDLGSLGRGPIEDALLVKASWFVSL